MHSYCNIHFTGTSCTPINIILWANKEIMRSDRIIWWAIRLKNKKLCDRQHHFTNISPCTTRKILMKNVVSNIINPKILWVFNDKNVVDFRDLCRVLSTFYNESHVNILKYSFFLLNIQRCARGTLCYILRLFIQSKNVIDILRNKS